jgi:hypothetical protein
MNAINTESYGEFNLRAHVATVPLVTDEQLRQINMTIDDFASHDQFVQDWLTAFLALDEGSREAVKWALKAEDRRKAEA